MALKDIISKGSEFIGSLGGSGQGSIAGTALGIGQAIAGRMAEKKADALLPTLNPLENQMLNVYRRKRKAIETGTAFNAQQNAANRLASNYMQNAFKAGGQANPAVLSQLGAQSAENIAAQSGQQLNQILQLEGNQAEKISNFGYDIANLRSARKSAKGARLQSDGTSNLLASLGMKPKKKDDNQTA